MRWNRMLRAVGVGALLVAGFLTVRETKGSASANDAGTAGPASSAGDAPAKKTAARTSKKSAPAKIATAKNAVTKGSTAQADPAPGGATVLPEVKVTATAPETRTPSAKAKYDLPNTTASITADQIGQRINAVDAEDTVKYLPSLFVRKRNNGDTQPVLATRTTGLNASARTLVYADDLLLTTLIANDNTKGAPRWGMVSPETIDRVDFLYGPFSAQYPGNSAGGVLLITTKMPDHLIADVGQTEAVQDFSLYGTHDAYRSDQTNVVYGDKKGDVSWLLADNFLNSWSQPLAFITSATVPYGTTGAIIAQNKTGAPANVVGAGGLLHAQMNDVSGKMQWDVSPFLKMTYQIDFWNNDTQSSVQTYLRNEAGQPTYATGIGGFAGNTYSLDESHLANAISLKTDTKEDWDWEVSASNDYYLEDIQRSPSSATGTAGFSSAGTITRMDGTNWTNGDIKAIFRPEGAEGAHELSFGFHADEYTLENPVYATPTWNSGSDTGTSRTGMSQGVTLAQALWAQDTWKFAPQWKFTFGGRIDFREAQNGYNQTTVGSLYQRNLNDVRFSPKASLDWQPSDEWELTGSFGQGYRFPTVIELYQTVTTGPILSNPNPGLRPENVLSEEIALQRKFKDGTLRLSVFNENVLDAIISQTNFVAGGAPTTFVTNVDSIRNTGVELAVDKENVIPTVDLFGSVTYVDSEILSDPSFVGTGGTTAKGKHVPYIPDWRATFGATWHPVPRLALTAVGRYSGTMYSTLDNTDTTRGVFGAFDSFLVADLRAEYKAADWIAISGGIDNVNGEKYFLYHPFPQRTFVAQVKLSF